MALHQPSPMNADTEKVRIDKWLWAARFFKTRSKAKDAVVGGKVHVNGERVKPARSVKVGDQLEVTLPAHQVIVVVKGLLDRRGSATVAQTLYEETTESVSSREEMAEARRAARTGMTVPNRKPSRSDRRRLARLKQSGWTDSA